MSFRIKCLPYFRVHPHMLTHIRRDVRTYMQGTAGMCCFRFTGFKINAQNFFFFINERVGVSCVEDLNASGYCSRSRPR